MTSPVTEKATKMNVWQMPESSPVLAKKFGIGQWSFIGPGSEKKWYSMEENSPQGIWPTSRPVPSWAERNYQQPHAHGVIPQGNLVAGVPINKVLHRA